MNNPPTAEPMRIPIGRNVTYAVRGMPEVANEYGPGYLIPTEISLTYRAAEDSQLGRFHAYVKGHWRRDGEVVSSGDKLPGQHYYGDPSTWPAWLAEEARLHDPAAVPAGLVAVPPTTTDRDRIAEERVARYLFDREWTRVIDLDAARGVLAVPSAGSEDTTTTRADTLREAAELAERLMDERYGPDCSYAIGGLDVATELRRLADEAQQQPETQARPARGDAVETWLKAQRDEYHQTTGPQWIALDEVLDAYRLHADMGVPLDGHVCEGRVVGDCECLELPAVVSAVPPQPEEKRRG